MRVAHGLLHESYFLILVACVFAPNVVDAAKLRFGPSLNADPGGGGESIPRTEFDFRAGIECPYPPCRPLRNQLLIRQKHDQQLKMRSQHIANGGLHEQPSEETEWPPKLNLVRGGGDCKICNQLLIGAGMNPVSLNKMRQEITHWLKVTDKLIESKPKDTFLKQNSIHIIECYHAFDRLTCTVEEHADEEAEND